MCRKSDLCIILSTDNKCVRLGPCFVVTNALKTKFDSFSPMGNAGKPILCRQQMLEFLSSSEGDQGRRRKEIKEEDGKREKKNRETTTHSSSYQRLLPVKLTPPAAPEPSRTPTNKEPRQRTHPAKET